MSQMNSVTRPHCVSHSEKDLFTNNWWKVDVDYALCKKTLWVMYKSCVSVGIKVDRGHLKKIKNKEKLFKNIYSLNSIMH